MRIELKDYPGTPETRYVVSYEPEDSTVKKLFQDEPRSMWLITPTRVIAREQFFAVKTDSTGTNVPERV